jgi:RPA family protein
MNDEELEKLMQEVSAEIEQMSADPEKPLSKAEKRHKVVLEARKNALDRIKTAREKGNLDREEKACMEYAVITEYAEKNYLLFVLARMKLASWVRI